MFPHRLHEVGRPSCVSCYSYFFKRFAPHVFELHLFVFKLKLSSPWSVTHKVALWISSITHLTDFLTILWVWITFYNMHSVSWELAVWWRTLTSKPCALLHLNITSLVSRPILIRQYEELTVFCLQRFKEASVFVCDPNPSGLQCDDTMPGPSGRKQILLCSYTVIWANNRVVQLIHTVALDDPTTLRCCRSPLCGETEDTAGTEAGM